MKTLILKHQGHEAHVPYELPDSLRFECFVPGQGMCVAYVDVRGEAIDVLEVREVLASPIDESRLPESLCNHPAVLEQAGDVVRTFLEALPIEWSECEKAEGESSVAFVHRANLIESSWNASTRPSDMAILSTIAEMALLESDRHTLYLRMPEAVRSRAAVPPSRPEDWLATMWLGNFIREVLVPRAQDLATVAAKRREAEWQAAEMIRHLESDIARRDDLSIDLAKERA